MSAVPIVPAVIPKSEAEAISFAQSLLFSREFHLDVVDGNFVQNVSWPIEPIGEPMALKPHSDKYTLEVDLMMQNPIPAARAWIKAGADMLIFHVETVDVASFVDFVMHSGGVSVGVSFHGDTPIESVFPYIAHADYVQVMGIHTIGLQGQSFSEKTFEYITRIKEEFSQLPIQVDGSVNAETIPRLIKAGVSRLIVGSAIVGKENPQEAYEALVALVNEL
jgi:ribulose-phosphate 3-epimerase